MQALKSSEILQATGGKLLSGNAETVIQNISTDSRSLKQGDLFIPIIGERFDGHNFIDSAVELGASAILTSRPLVAKGDGVFIEVEDTSKALRDIAAYYRQRFYIPVVGITGSVGKTSTKDMIACVLGEKFNVLKTEGNFNNEIGLPLTVFRLEEQHEAVVLEMGMSGLGEISRLTAIARPDIAVITNIGMAHIEKLGSRQNILKAKMEILEGLDKNGLVILNGDDKLLYGTKDLLKFRTVFYGTEDGLDYQAFNISNLGESGTSFEITIGNCDYKVHLNVPGIHNVYNALAAIAVGMELNLPINMIIEGISRFSPSKMRMNIISYAGYKVINDVYNASPQSMEAAINVLKDIAEGGKTFAILGDMLEMGEWAKKAHYDVGKYAALNGIDYIVTVGENGKHTALGAVEAGVASGRVASFENNLEAGAFVKGLAKNGDVILVKGSRGMKMEEIVKDLTGES